MFSQAMFAFPSAGRRGRNILITFILALTFALSPAAFAAKVKLNKLPDKLGRNGMVVVQVGPDKWEDAELRLSNGKKGRAHDGFFVYKLKPGRYTLDTVKRLADSDYSSYATTLTYSILTVDRAFEIKPGKVTHLGMLYFLEEPDATKEKQEFIVLPFENQGPEQLFLQEYYPKLAATVGPDDVIRAPGEYLNDKIGKAREILFQLSAKQAYELHDMGNEFAGMSVNGPMQISESNYFVGDLGLIARPDNGNLEILETETLDRIRQVRFSKANPWFYSQTGGLYRVQGKRLAHVATSPVDFYPTGGAMLSDNAIVLNDRRFNFVVSLDEGRTWNKTDTLSTAQNQSLTVRYSAGSQRVYAMGHDSAYLLKKPAAAIIDRATGIPVEFAVPKKIKKGMKAVFETDAGLFVQTENFGAPSALYFQRTGTEDWIKNEILTYFGCQVSFPDRSGTEIIALCGIRDKFSLLSQDFGKTWYRYEPQVSRTE